MDDVTMADLLRLQEEVGTKKLTTAVSQTSQKKKFKKKVTDPSAPQETSLVRHAVPLNAKKEKIKPSVSKARDPRFDDLSGELNLEKWQKNYWYVQDLRENEKKELVKACRKIKKKTKLKAIKETLQRMDNQQKAHSRKALVEGLKIKQKYNALKQLSRGEKPHFSNPNGKKMKEEQIQKLKKSGKYDKHVRQQEKRQIMKDKKANPFLKL